MPDRLQPVEGRAQLTLAQIPSSQDVAYQRAPPVHMFSTNCVCVWAFLEHLLGTGLSGKHWLISSSLAPYGVKAEEIAQKVIRKAHQLLWSETSPRGWELVIQTLTKDEMTEPFPAED
ncbi:hypothetical protein MDA_GLEAN10017138 [Myotis davidii]|uniref:Uncharacterized protein n=1 Tax=Myotis davidii TaxID=225400 RepID=L5LHG6_MYODS|nr:hypothetical protein MDA_GLEAN10017138 [Myotis davidii]